MANGLRKRNAAAGETLACFFLQKANNSLPGGQPPKTPAEWPELNARRPNARPKRYARPAQSNPAPARNAQPQAAPNAQTCQAPPRMPNARP